MKAARTGFYHRVLSTLLSSGTMRRDMSVLVVAGGLADRAAFVDNDFTNVVISNVDRQGRADEFDPYPWREADAEQLPFADGEFDFVMVSAALHHCASPHRALVEMHRVARSGVVALESRDSLLMRAALRLGLVGEYELEAVVGNGLTAGGLRNGPIPNYVYRWTEREVEKTIKSYAPIGRHRFLYFYEFEVPQALLEMRRSITSSLVRGAAPAARLAARILPSQANLFAFVVLKPRLPDDLHPWLRMNGCRIEPNAQYLNSRFRAPPNCSPNDKTAGIVRH